MRPYKILCLYLLFPTFLYAQETKTNEYRYQALFHTDNDFFVGFARTDRFYTYGLRLQFNWQPKNEQYIFKSSKDRINKVTFDMKAFTPEEDNVIKDNKNIYRPFAGWSYVGYKQLYIFNNNLLEMEIQGGVMGPSSRASQFQNWFHENVKHIPPFPGWQNQIEDFIGVNIKGSYMHPLKTKQNWQLLSNTEVVLGNVNIHFKPSLIFVAGLINLPVKSVSTGTSILREKGDNEILFKTEAGIKLVGYDATLQDNLFRNSNPLEYSTINRAVFFVAPALQWVGKRFYGTLMLKYSRGEIRSANNHHFGRISIGYSFN